MYQLLIGMLVATLAAAIPANWIGLWLGRRPAAVTTDSVARRTHYLVLAVLFAAFLVYGSLLPFNFEPKTLEDGIARFRGIPYLPLGIGQERADWIATILMWLPLGYLWLGALTVDERSTPFRLFGALLTSVAVEIFALAIEFTQVWFPPRTVSQNDVLGAAAGGLVGVTAWLLLGELATRSLRAFHISPQSTFRLHWLSWAYAIGLTIYWLTPMDFILSADELWRKYQEGRIELVPLADLWSGYRSWSGVLLHLVAWVPVGWLAAETRRERAGHWASYVGATLGFGALVEVVRVVVFTRYSSTTNLLLSGLGISAGAAASTRWAAQAMTIRRLPAVRLMASQSAPWIVLALAYAGIVLAWVGSSSEFNDNPDWTGPRLEGFLVVPFARMYWNSKFGALTNVLQKIMLFVPLGALIGRSITLLPISLAGKRGLKLLGLSAAATVALLVELIQVFQIAYRPDITDVLLGGAGGWLGMKLVTLVYEERPKTTASWRPVAAAYGLVVFLGCVVSFLVWDRYIPATDVGATTAGPIDASAPRQPREDTGQTSTGQSSGQDTPREKSRSSESASGEIVFGAEPPDPYRAPRFIPIALPRFVGGVAIWGATGRDHTGHIWFGISTSGGSAAPAHLCELNPDSGEVTDRGDVLSALRESGAYRAGMGQMKIHSRVIQAGDGHLYFASMDEQGEDENGGRLPTWGSHFWRLRLPEHHWEHLFAAPEGLIAVAGAGRWVYALGYFGHMLYQYDTATGRVRSTVVGAVDGHISRNFFTDHRGHVFVPRMRRFAAGNLQVTLVEFDPSLREIGETELKFYTREAPTESHGIVAFQPLADRSIVFATDRGFLYQVVPREDDRATVSELGWFHPDGEAYVATMFTYSGRQFVLGVGRRSTGNPGPYQWLVFDLNQKRSTVVPIDANDPVHRAFYVYGSIVRDNQGRFYVVGGSPGATVAVTPELQRAVLAVGGSEDDLAALRAAATPQDGPALFRVEAALDPIRQP